MTQDELLKELAPHLCAMEQIFYDLQESISKQNLTDEEVFSSACLGAVMGGLTISRKSLKVTEKVDNIIHAQEIFMVHMSLLKMIRMGILDADITDKVDENGWPVLKLNFEPYKEGDKDGI